MHKLLHRQLKQARQPGAGSELDLDLFLQLVDAAYAEVDRERRITAHAHQVMRDEQAELIKRQLETHATILRIGNEKAEAERGRAIAEAAMLREERLSLLGRLTATVAHELRNPLSTIRNTIHAIDLMARGKEVDFERQMARVLRTIDRCDGIITDLLDYAGGRDLHAAPMHLDSWLGEVLDGQRIPGGIAIERRLGCPAAVVPVDGERLRCAVVNLIENAAEAIGSVESGLPERRITISTHTGAMAEIVVADTGPGMPSDVLARVFEPLYSTRPFGTGLGLPTAKLIIEQHGGDIAIASTPGTGTRVVIRLPLGAAKSSEAA